MTRTEFNAEADALLASRDKKIADANQAATMAMGKARAEYREAMESLKAKFVAEGGSFGR